MRVWGTHQAFAALGPSCAFSTNPLGCWNCKVSKPAWWFVEKSDTSYQLCFGCGWQTTPERTNKFRIEGRFAVLNLFSYIPQADCAASFFSVSSECLVFLVHAHGRLISLTTRLARNGGCSDIIRSEVRAVGGGVWRGSRRIKWEGKNHTICGAAQAR